MSKILLMIAAALTFAAVAAAVPVGRFVIASGGLSVPASDGSHGLVSTAGQPAVGVTGNAAGRHCAGFWCFGAGVILAVDPSLPASLPAVFSLGPATPNPTHGEAHFRLALPERANVTLSAFDVAGRRIGEPVVREFDAGMHDLYWRAPGANAGIYFVQVATDGVIRARREITLLH